jgi:hypothetical protein
LPWAAGSRLLGGYLALTVLYSALLKELVFIDVLVVAAGFVLRVVGGAVAIDVPVSRWLLLCAYLLALYLALGKRRAELTLLGEGAGTHRVVLGHYTLPLVDQAISVVLAPPCSPTPCTVARRRCRSLRGMMATCRCAYGLSATSTCCTATSSEAAPSRVLISIAGRCSRLDRRSGWRSPLRSWSACGSAATERAAIGDADPCALILL